VRFSDFDQKASPISRDEREIVDPYTLARRDLPRSPVCSTKSRGRGDHDNDGRHAEGNASRLVKLRGVSLYNIVRGRQAEPLSVGLVHRRGRKNPSSFTC